MARVSTVPIFRRKGQRSRSLEVKNLHSNLASCLFKGGGSGADCKLGLTIVRPNLLSTPEMLSNWTTAAYHVGTRRRHLFLF